MDTTITDSLDAGVDAGVVNNNTDPDPERARGPRRYSATYKARILDEYADPSKADKGALLRREGLYSLLISQWRRQRDRGAIAALASRQAAPRPIPATARWPGCVAKLNTSRAISTRLTR